MTSQTEEIIGQGMGGRGALATLRCVINLEALQTLHLGVFVEVSLQRHNRCD